MDAGRRLRLIGYNAKARQRLAGGGGARPRSRVIATVFYGNVVGAGGCGETRGRSAPKTRAAGRATAMRHLPRLVNPYGGQYGPSPGALYHKGYAMAEKPRCRATVLRGACREHAGAAKRGRNGAAGRRRGSKPSLAELCGPS